ncbi:MAG: lipocalin-like domain-containing protein [Xanthobacteraceae bacterium]|nr:lipocalin-like domain-containing protein [Xanthobacteraceae bacterium]
MNKADIAGRWHILRWQQQYDDGRVVSPMGSALEGFIHYGEDGRMVCLIARADRVKFLTGGQWDASDTEKAQAYNSYMNYAGRYTVGDGEIRHHVEHSLFPNWVGGVQVRKARFEGGELWLTARLEDGTPAARTVVLAWERAAAGGKA